MSKDLPAIPDRVDGDLRRALVRMREELQALMGTRGSDPAVRLTQITGGAGGGALVFLPGTGPGGGVDAPDLTPPPTPTFGPGDAFGGISQVIVTWSGINYTQGHGNKQTIVYAVKKDPSDPTMPTFPGDAGIVAIAPHALTIIAIPSEPNTRWHIWLKFESIDGVQSTSPAGGTNGVQATTGQDVQDLMDVLTRSIRERHLWDSLLEPIRSIIRRADDAAEDALRAALALHQEAKQAGAALLAEARDRGTAISQTRTLVATGDAQLASQITTLSATVSGNTAAIQEEQTARANADSAEANERSLLAAQMRGAYTGTDLGSVTSGLLYAERQARVSADGAAATRLDGLESSVDTPSTGLLSRATALEMVTTHADSGNTALASRASALESTVNDTVNGVVATAAALDLVEATVNHGTTGVVALANRTSTLEARVTTPSATPGDPAYNVSYALVQAEASTRATQTGDLYAQYTVKTDINGFVAGYGLASTLNTATPFSEFAVRVDRFYVAPTVNYTSETAPVGASINQRWYKPSTKETKRWDGAAWVAFNNLQLVVNSAPTVEGGVTLPAGVYMDAAYIINLTATYARFQSLIADQIVTADISAARLTLGDGTVGGNLKSTSYVGGSGTSAGTGWLLQPSGNAFFNNAVIYGTVYASAGAIGGNTINSTGMQSPGYTAGSTGWRLDTTGLVRAFASAGARVLDMAATGTSPVLKIGSALELLANGDAYFGGRLAIGSVSANGSTTASASFPSLPNSSATYNTGSIAFSPAATITGVGGNIAAWVSCDIRVAAESTSVDAIRVFAYLYRNGTQVDSSEVFLRSCVFPDPTGATRTIAAEVTLLSPLEPLTGAQTFTISFSVQFRDSAGATVSPGPTAFTSYLQVTGRCNLQEIKV